VGGVTAVAGSSTISLVDIGLAANTSCTFRLNVTGTTLGTKVDTTDAVTSDQGTGGTASASITVVAAVAAPARRTFRRCRTGQYGYSAC
jgi:hypothetical protein